MTKPNMEPKVLFNKPIDSLHGGHPTHLPFLYDELVKKIAVSNYYVGRKTDRESTVFKITDRIHDYWLLLKKIRQFKPNLIHHNSAFDVKTILRDFPVVIICKLFRIPVMVKIHGSSDTMLKMRNPVILFFVRLFLRQISCIGVLSEIEKEEFKTLYNINPGNIAVVKNIIKPVFFSTVRKESEHPTFLFVSRILKKKGIYDLLDAIPGILTTLPDSRFYIVGSGEEVNDLELKISNSGLGDNIILIKSLDNNELITLHAFSWAIIFPTYFPEGMPMVIAEAMAAGVPVITTRTRFSLSYMTEAVHCLYIEKNNPASIVKQVAELSGNAVLRVSLAENNKKLATNFSSSVVADEFIELYASIIRRYYKPRT